MDFLAKIDAINHFEPLGAEVWIDIENFDGKYQISNMGRVKSLKRQKEKILSFGKRGRDRDYLFVILYKKSKSYNHAVHRLVAQHFIPNPLNLPEVNHLWGNKNDCRAIALEWSTSSDNRKHAIRIGLSNPKPPIHKFEDSHFAKLNKSDVIEIRTKYYLKNIKTIDLAKEYNVSQRNIYSIINNKTWNF